MRSLDPGQGFAHLHVRSGFSYGFGVATPAELATAASEMGMEALALTDRDGLSGIPRFFEAAAGAGVSPVLGAEVSVDGGGHLVLLADGMTGYRSLCRLITRYRCSSEDRRKPLCPLPTILEHAGGLVCLTGAVPFGHVPRLVLSGRTGRRTGSCARCGRPSERVSTSSSQTTGRRGAGGGWGGSRSSPGATASPCSRRTR